MKPKIVVMIGVLDDESISKFIEEDCTLEEYVQNEMGWVAESGIISKKIIIKKPGTEDEAFINKVNSELKDFLG